MKQRKSKFLKRLGTFALTSMVAMSPVLSAIPPLTVQAAHTTNNPYVNANSYTDVAGHLHIGMSDAGIYGTWGNGKVNSGATLDKTSAWGYWKDTTLTLADFAHTPEGMSTFDTGLKLGVYKLNGSVIDTRVGNVVDFNTSTGYFDVDFTASGLGGDANFVDGKYVIIQENAAPTGILQTHTNTTAGWYIMFDKTGTTYTFYPDPISSPGAGVSLGNLMTTGCHVMFEDDMDTSTGYAEIKPLDNRPLACDFTFAIDDKDLEEVGQSQGDGHLNDAVFAVFNVSEGNNRGKADNKGYSTSGYVVVDYGTAGYGEGKIPVPAYSLSEIKTAYDAYLTDYIAAVTAGEADDFYDAHIKTDANGTDWFNLSGYSAYGTHAAAGAQDGKNVTVACMLVEDTNGDGKFDTLDTYKGLPVGDYLVLQVKAGEGYYIDETFRPVINIGSYAAIGDRIAGSSTGAAASGGANYIGTGYNHFADNRYSSIYTPVYLNVADDGTGNPTPPNYNLDVTSFTANVTQSGASTSSAASATYTTASGWTFQQNDGIAENNKSRLNPVVGQSRLRCHDTIIRGMDDLFLADSDDVRVAIGSGKHQNVHSTRYDQEAQGDGNLNIAKYTITNNSANPVMINGNRINAGNSFEIDGAASLTTQYPGITSTIDMFPYGSYEISQTTFGVGYEADPSTEGVAALPATIDVDTEDQLTIENAGGAAITPIQNTTRDYFTNNLINGGEIYTVVTNSGVGTDEVTLKVYNVSDHYVWVDKNEDGNITYTNGDERFETIQTVYQNQIKGKSLTMDAINNILTTAGAVACKEVTVSKDVPYTADETLPYGRYIVVVSAIPAGYTLVTDPVIEGTTVNGEHGVKDLVATVRIERATSIPVIETVHLEASNKIDSVKVENEVALYDIVNVSNLDNNTKYRVYGVIVDKTTGEIVDGQFATGVFTSSNGGSATVDALTVNTLISTVPAASDQAAMATWFAEVKNANLSQSITSAANSALNLISNDTFRDSFRTQILGELNALKASTGGTGSISLYFPSRNMWPHEGETYVAYEYLVTYTANPVDGWNTATSLADFETKIDATTALAMHNDINDEDQTVYVPTLDVTAKASLSGGKTIDPTETVVGTVPVGNLEPGNTYKVVVELHDEANNVISCGGKTQFETTFVATDTTKTITQVFDGLDAAKYNKQRLTVYATLYRVENGVDYQLIRKGDPDSVGYTPDPSNPGPNQVDVLAPTVTTKLTGKNNAKTVDFSDEDEKVKLTDEVTYTDLVVGASYKAVLTLVDSDGVTLLDDDGAALTASKTFTATTSTMKIEIPIEFIATRIAGQKVIAYNDLYRINGSVTKVVATEHDLKASDQTITAKSTSNKPRLTTTAIDSASKTHTLSAEGGSIIDTVKGSYLDPNTEYLLITEVAVNGAVFDRVEPIETKVETDDEGNFVAKVTIGGLSVDALSGKTIVVFETLMNKANTKVIVEHKDVDDKNQTVYVGTLTTTATSELGEKTIACGKDTVIVDQVHYTGLSVGTTYTMTTTAVLNVNGSGSPIGTPVKTQFTPTASSGDITVKITVDTSELGGKDITIFESIKDDYSGVVMIKHEDVNDAAQTVKVAGGNNQDNPSDNPHNDSSTSTSSDPDPEKPQTGVDQFYGLYLVLASVMIGISVFGYAYLLGKKRKKVKADNSDK